MWIGFVLWIEDVFDSKWWLVFLLAATVLTPLIMWQMGFRGSSDGAECINYGVRAESC